MTDHDKMHYKLQQLKNFITDNGIFWSFDKYVNILLQITTGIINCGVITNYVVTTETFLFCVFPYLENISSFLILAISLSRIIFTKIHKKCFLFYFFKKL